MRIKDGLARLFFATLIVAVSAVSAFAADVDDDVPVAPLNFSGASGDEQQQDFWDDLMAFKMWGTDTVSFFRATMPGVTGAVGSAGGLYMGENSGVGGPIYVGRDISTATGNDTIYTGPVRVKGNFNAGNNSNSFWGTLCVEGSVNSNVRRDLKPAFTDADGVVHAQGVVAPNATSGDCSLEEIKDVPTYLSIPTLSNSPTYPRVEKAENGTIFIDVPPLSEGRLHDFYFESISTSNKSKLYVRMQSNRSLARIFLRTSIDLSSETDVQIVYVDENAEFKDGSWTNVTDPYFVPNDEYAGNVLFYMNGDMSWTSCNHDVYRQGSYMSTGTIRVGAHLKLAGQLLAKKLHIDYEFDGKGFRYVPFNNPVVDIVADDRSAHLKEGNPYDDVKIVLDKPAKGLISFQYCFLFEGNENAEKGDGDGKAHLSDFDDTGLPLYNGTKCVSPRTAYFNEGEVKLAEPIRLHVTKDQRLEDDETFKLRIENLEGATLKDGKHEGFITLTIDDGNSLLSSSGDAEITVTEDTKYFFKAEDFKVTDTDGELWDGDFGILIVTPPHYDSLRTKVKPGNNDAGKEEKVDYKKVIDGKLIGVPKDMLGGGLPWDVVYNPPKDSFGVKFDSLRYVVLLDGNASVDTFTLYINITPVNDAPVPHPVTFTIKENVTLADPNGAGIANGSWEETAEGKKIEDVDDDVFTFKFDDNFDAENTEENYNKVTSLYTIDPNTGSVAVKEGAALNYESVDSLLHIRVVVTDKSASTDVADPKSGTTIITIQMIDVNEDPSITDSRTFEIPENSTKGTEVLPAGWDRTTDKPSNPSDPAVKGIMAEDPDRSTVPFGQLTYEIVTPDVPFVINPTTGVITVAEDAELDYENTPSYEVTVKVSDAGSKDDISTPATKTFTINVTDVNEIPHFVKDNAPNYDQDEKTPKHEVKNGDLVKEWEVIDEDSYDDLKNLTLTLTQVGFDSDKDAGKASVKDIFELTSETRPGKNGDRDSMFVKLVVKDADKLNHELVMKDWNDSVFNVVIKVEDAEFSDTLQRTITIRDLNETPVVAEGQVFEVPEYDGKNVVTEVLPKGWNEGDPKNVVASDSDRVQVPNGQFTYSIAEKDTPFQISENGVITVKSGVLLDHEDVPSYTITVWVKDKGNPADSSFATVTINVRDENEKPELVKDDESNYPIEEKTVNHAVTKGTLINEWEFIDVDGSDDISNLELDIEHVNCDKNVCIAADETGKVGLKDIFSLNTVSRMGDDGKNHMFVQLVVENPDKLNHEPVMKDWKDSAFTFVLSVTDDGDAKDTLIRKVTVRDVNETPAITDTREFTIAESVGENPATKVLPKLWVEGEPDYVLAHDSDRVEVPNGKYEYSIADNPYFAIDPVKGVITVKNGVKIDYEDPALEKVGDDKIYKVTVSVKDKGVGKLESSKEITIYVTNENEGPELNDDGKTWIVDEHVQSHDFGSLIATDVDEGDEDNFTWTINMETADAPAELFKIDSKTGEVSVNGSLNDFETLWNKAIYNEETHALEFKVSITVEDEAHASSTLPKVISIRDVNETPVIADQKFIVKENTLAGDTVRPEGWKKGNPSNVQADENDEHSLPNGQFEYSIVGETPFKIDPVTGVITVKADSTLNHEDPTLTGSTYPVTVKVKDKGNPADSATAVISIYIDDDNDKPEIIPDPKCDENKEECHKCDPEKEVCTPVTVCDATIEKCDDVCDASKEKCDPDPECKEGQCGYAVNKDTVYISVKENTGKDYKVLEYYVFDEDEADLEKMTISFVDVNGSGSKDLFKITETLEDGNKLVMTTAIDIDYESVNEIHKILIIANDGQLADTIVRVIKIVDENEAPSAEDFKDVIPENLPNGTVVGTVVASDPDTKNPAYGTLSYRVVEDGVPFAMKDGGNKIVVTNSAALNYEKDSIFVFHVEVSDGTTEPAVSVVTIKLSNEPENPEIIPDPKCDENDENCHKCDESKEDCSKPCDAMVTDCDKPVPPEECIGNCKGGKDKDGHIYVNVPENSPEKTVVLEYLVQDEDFGDLEKLEASFTQTDANKSGADTLFKAGIKNVGTEEKPEYKVYVYVNTDDLDYEKVKPSHEIVLIVTDPNGLQDTVIRTINVIDVNEPPFVVKKTFDFDEHTDAGVVIDTVKWGDDKDTKNPAFRDNKVVVVGGDSALFSVDSVGVIKTKKYFNYEEDKPTYTLIVQVVDKNDPDLYVQDTMTIILNNLPETPKITTTEFEVPENVPTATEIGVIQAKDPDGEKEILTFKLLEPSDFVTVTEDGTILVKDGSKFDHEVTDEFTIKVSVSDTSGKSSDTLITIKITDVNERPTLVDQTVTVPEDTKVGSAVDTVKAKDPDSDPKYSTLTYKIVGGDSTTFSVDPKTGEVKLVEPLDYESKDQYKLVVEVDDGEFKETATLTIKVGDVKEESKVDIILVENPKQSWHNPDTIYTNIPDNVLTWVQDGDTLTMDTTLHDGPNVIIIEYLDPKKDTPGRDTVVIYYSAATPVVSVSAGADPTKAGNIYTIVEKTDKADSNVYVNSNKNDIVIKVTDTAAKVSDSVVVSVELGAVDLPKDNFTSIANSVAGEVLLNINPSSTPKYTAFNGDEVKVTYVEKVNGKEVEVSYMISKDEYDKVEKGGSLPDPKKTEVVGDDGKVESIEVITVSYNVEMGGKVVTLSYLADAATGEVLVKDADGRVMTSAAVENHNKKVTSGSSSNGSSGSGTSGNGSSNSSNGSSSNGSSSSSNGSSSNGSSNKFINAGMFTVTYEVVSDGKPLQVSYVADKDGDFVKNSEGDAGYSVSYTYTNKFGNTASQSVFIVVDQVGPKVEILYPTESQVIQSNSVTVKWTVDGVIQDTLNVQGLEKGVNAIVRFYRDKAGNEASDTVFVVMKDGKDVEIAIETPVVVLTQEKVEEYYAANPPKKGQTFGVSLRNPTSGEEAETLIGGEFKTTAGSGKTPYPGVSGDAHLGPTLALDVKMPVITDIGGMATLDDLVNSDGWVALDGVDADNSDKIGVDAYVAKYCEDGFNASGDLSKANLYNTKMDVRIWIYTTLGTFVDYYSFTQDLNDPRFADEAGLLQMYFEMKPDKNGDVRSESGKLYATGSYLYKVDVSTRSELRCTLPPVKDEAGKKKGDVIKSSEELLKPFGYKRPQKK